MQGFSWCIPKWIPKVRPGLVDDEKQYAIVEVPFVRSFLAVEPNVVLVHVALVDLLVIVAVLSLAKVLVVVEIESKLERDLILQQIARPA